MIKCTHSKIAAAGSIFAVALVVCLSNSPVTAQPSSFGPGPSPTTPLSPQLPQTPPPNITTTTTTTTVSTPPPRFTITTPQTPFFQPIVVPTDVTNANPDLSGINGNVGEPTAGLMPAKSFPSMDELGGPTDFILVNGDESSYKRETPYLVNFFGGTVLVSVKKPSNLGMLNTPLGEVAFTANSDAFVSYDNGVLRIRNVDGLGQTVKVRLDKGPFAGTSAHAYTIAPGYELVLGEHKLTGKEMRPSDGILRRRSQAIDDGYGSISQFEVQSALQSSALIPKMVAVESDAKVKRVLSDMSRMAAVLNHVNGAEGYGQ